MESNYTVSIIVPVYNAEAYLRDCVDSIISQTYKNIEVILVNDGSTDKSGMICDEYKKIDHRIKVIHQENSGPSVARNTGIHAVTGTYIQFVDADDQVEPDMTKKLVEAMEQKENTQLVMCGFKTKGFTVSRNVPYFEGVYSKKEFLNFFGRLFRHNLINAPINKLYSAELISKFQISFKENVDLGEDLLFNLDYLEVCNQIAIIKDELYSYLVQQNSNSLTKIYRNNLFDNQQMLFQRIREFLIKYEKYEGENRDLIEIVYVNNLIVCLDNLFHVDKREDSHDRKKYLINIINNEVVKENISYFFCGDMQKRLVGFLFKYKAVNLIYCFFKVKSILRHKIKPLFYFLRNVNRVLFQRGKW